MMTLHVPAKWLAIACVVLASGCSTSTTRPRCPGLTVRVSTEHVRVVNTATRAYADVTAVVGSQVGRFRATLDRVEPRSEVDVTETLRDGADGRWRPLTMRATTAAIEAGCR